ARPAERAPAGGGPGSHAHRAGRSLSGGGAGGWLLSSRPASDGNTATSPAGRDGAGPRGGGRRAPAVEEDPRAARLSRGDGAQPPPRPPLRSPVGDGGRPAGRAAMEPQQAA